MTIKEGSGFCPSTGIYKSKWPSPFLPKNPSSFPLHLFSHIPPDNSTKPAFINAATDHSLTFADLQNLTISSATYLHFLGIKKGDVVLLISPNSIHFPIVLLSIMSLGAIFSTINFLSTRQEIQAQVTEKIAWHDPAGIMYSSGTTGKSKGVVLTHGCLIAMSSMVGHMWRMNSSDETFMCVVPMFHMFGIAMLLCGAIGIGSTVVVMAKYEVGEMIEAVRRYGVTKIPVAPPVVVQLLQLDMGSELSSLEELICSGAPLGKEHLERFRKRFPSITLSQCYGLTEAGVVTLDEGSESKFDASEGKLVPFIEAKIVDVDTKMALPPNKCGELHVRGPSIMRGYWRNQEATSHAIDREGWLHTGDLCYIDLFGRLYIIDRIKEIIKYKAYQVVPAELEEILLSHPEISDVAVVSQSDEEAGEIPVACVVRKPGDTIQDDGIIRFVESKVAPFKKIRKVIFVDTIPRSASGKILRRKLKASILENQLKITSSL